MNTYGLSCPVPQPSGGDSFWQILHCALDSDEKTARLRSVLLPLLNRGCLTVLGMTALVVTATTADTWWTMIAVLTLGGSGVLTALARYRRRSPRHSAHR